MARNSFFLAAESLPKTLQFAFNVVGGERDLMDLMIRCPLAVFLSAEEYYLRRTFAI